MFSVVWKQIQKPKLFFICYIFEKKSNIIIYIFSFTVSSRTEKLMAKLIVTL